MPSKAKQNTIIREAKLQGPGLFSGKPCELTFRQAEAGTGIVFTRTDLPEPARIAVTIGNLAASPRRTTLRNGAATIDTVEHVLSAIAGMGIDNLQVDVTGPEIPNWDGSPKPFVDSLLLAGKLEQDLEQNPYVITEPVTVSEGVAVLTALPCVEEGLYLLYDLDYSAHPGIGRQVFAFRLGKDDYAAQLAPARTFLLEEEARELRTQGIGEHLTERDILVMGSDGPINNELRFPDEHARHKLCDLLGDLALFGRPLYGRIIAHKSGHALNHKLVGCLTDQFAANQRCKQTTATPLLDIRHIQRILPHRYPFLMIDRIIELDGDRRAVGIKNVTINEPFFQGHYPTHPVMPGVLVLEAMAQLSGILLSRRLDNTGKVAMLVSMDRVKIRRAALPGDQLVIQAETLHIRSRTGHCKCRVMIGDRLAAEAEIKFMLVDEDAG